MQWAYWSADDWVVVDKVIMESADVPTDVEKGKAIGFEGRADPSTGFYCLYNEGYVSLLPTTTGMVQLVEARFHRSID